MSDQPVEQAMPGRITRLETELSGLSRRVDEIAKVTQAELESLRGEGREQARQIVAQIQDLRRSDEVGRDRLAAVGKPNWAILISAGGLIIVLVGAIGSAWVVPLVRMDVVHDAQISALTTSSQDIESRLSEQAERLARLDERSRFAVYVGVPQKPMEQKP